MTPTAASPATAFEFDPTEATALRRLDDAVMARKLAYADAAFVALRAAADAEAAAKALADAQRRLEDRIAELAAARGVDLGDPAAGRWVFDFKTMTLRRG